MGRLLDEDDVIAEIRNHKKFVKEIHAQEYGDTDGITDLYFLAHDHIEEAIKAKVPSFTPKPQWIPCSERLPERNGRYLVTRGLNACGSLWNRTYIANYSDLMGLKKEKIWWDGNVGKSDFAKLDDVIAWMPLPSPYQAERREE